MVTNLIVKSNDLSSVEFLPEKCKFQKIRIIILSKSRGKYVKKEQKPVQRDKRNFPLFFRAGY
jgi:hypothetical protein